MKVLMIRGGALGDTLMLLPALSVLPPGVEVTFVGREPGLGFMGSHVDLCLDLERSGWHRLFQGAEAGGHLPVADADRVIAFFADRRGEVERNLKTFFPLSHVYTFPSSPPKDAVRHVARYVARCLHMAGLPLDEKGTMENARNGPLIKNTTPPEDRDCVVFHPGSGDVKKNHPPEVWCRLVDAMRRQAGQGGRRLVILLGPAEKKRRPVFERRFKGSDTEIMCCPSKQSLTSILKSARLLIGHDSGVSHLSAMMGIPTIALFRTSDPVQWQPLGPSVRVITDPLPAERLLERVLKASKRALTPL